MWLGGSKDQRQRVGLAYKTSTAGQAHWGGTLSLKGSTWINRDGAKKEEIQEGRAKGDPASKCSRSSEKSEIYVD